MCIQIRVSGHLGPPNPSSCDPSRKSGRLAEHPAGRSRDAVDVQSCTLEPRGVRESNMIPANEVYVYMFKLDGGALGLLVCTQKFSNSPDILGQICSCGDALHVAPHGCTVTQLAVNVPKETHRIVFIRTRVKSQGEDHYSCDKGDRSLSIRHTRV